MWKYSTFVGFLICDLISECTENIVWNVICIYERAGVTTQVQVTKPAQTHKYNTKAVQVHNNKTLNTQNRNNIEEESNIKEILGQKPLYAEKT